MKKAALAAFRLRPQPDEIPPPLDRVLPRRVSYFRVLLSFVARERRGSDRDGEHRRDAAGNSSTKTRRRLRGKQGPVRPTSGPAGKETIWAMAPRLKV